MKSILKYVVTLTIAFWLLRYVYKDQDVPEMLQRLKHVDFQWIFYTYLIAIASHFLRAYRWTLLLRPLGYYVSVPRTFLAVMVGYFVNLIIPRAGEISRCGMLKKTDNVNITTSIGTVVAERAVDLVMLIMVVMLAFLVEFRLLNQYITGFIQNRMVQISKNILIVYIVIGILMIIALAIYIFIRTNRRFFTHNAIYLKVRFLMRELVEGFSSIRKVGNFTGFILSSIFIWILYFLMSFIAFNVIPETTGLGLVAGLSILAMSSLGMLAPVQGGIGAYHALVTGVLTFYGLQEQDAAFFAGLLHSSQVLMVLVLGGSAFLVSFLINKRDAKKTAYPKI